MNILVYANCQTNQLVYGLMLALAGKANVHGIDMNHPEHKNQLKAFSAQKSAVDYVFVNTYSSDVYEYFSPEKIVEIPSIHFGGFHPDVVYFSLESTPDKPQFFMNNPTVSAIGLWTTLTNIDVGRASSLYNEEVFTSLGYMDYFDVACHAIRANYQKHDIQLAYIDRHLSGRDVFMYGPMHPKFEVTLSLCFGLLDKLNIRPVIDYQQIKSIMVDPLQYEYAWGCFPPLAQRLGVEGSWLIRHHSHIFLTMTNYLEQLHSFIRSFRQQNGAVQMIERDKERFTDFHKIDGVLRSYL
jgi:hypothetical protein